MSRPRRARLVRDGVPAAAAAPAVVAVSIIAIVVLLARHASASAEEPAAAPATGGIAAALAGIDGRPLDELWPLLEGLKKDFAALDAALAAGLNDELAGRGDRGKLAGAALLSTRSERALHERGQFAYQQLARSASEKAVRIAAIRLLRSPPAVDPAYVALKGIADKTEEDADVRIEACLSLWAIDNHHSARLPLLKLLDGEGQVRGSAALALAETGYLEPPVPEVLREIRREPTDRGRRADVVLRAAASGPDPKTRPPRPPAPERTEPAPAGKSAGSAAGAGGWGALIEEVVQLVRQHAVDRDQASPRKLYTAALEGMLSSIDEYSTFQGPEEMERIEARRLGVHWGLGAQLVKPAKDQPLVVVRPHYDGPAYRAGIRTGDRILEVNGISTHDREPEEIRRLTMPAGTEGVHLLVLRWGWEVPRTFTLEKSFVEVPQLRVQLFPERIGYLKLARFGPRSGEDIRNALGGLEALGLRALILDLRDNPGGNLDQAVEVADLFLGKQVRPIVTERGPGGAVSERFATAEEEPRHPMVVLVNRLSASAAEVVAGALQDFKRAQVIGTRTFGKGVKQVAVPLPPHMRLLLGGQGRLIITTSHLYLPLGRSIQGEHGTSPRASAARGGIEPDITVADRNEIYGGRQLAELARVQFSRELTEYIHRHYASIKHLFDQGDLWDPDQYPSFDELYQSLHTTLTRDEVRQAVRSLIRRHVEDERGEELASDLREDDPLQRAILELLDRLGVDPLGVTEYRAIAERRAGEVKRKEE
jgi:carboxyl-terminal processing protease